MSVYMLLRALDLVEVQLDRLGEIAQRLRDRAALAGHIDLETLRHVPVFFLVHGSGEVSRRIHNPKCCISPILRLPDCTRCPSCPFVRYTRPNSCSACSSSSRAREIAACRGGGTSV